MNTDLSLELTDQDSRIIELRQRCLERKSGLPPLDGDPRLMVASLRASCHEASWTLRRAWLTRDLLSGMVFAVDDLELLVGRLAPDHPEWQTERQAALDELNAGYPQLYTPGQSGHCQLDMSGLFAAGVDGLRAELRSRQRRARSEKALVFQSFEAALQGLSIMIENAARTAEEARESASQSRRRELDEMAAACRHIAHQPPVSFRQGLQLYWLVILGCHFADRAWLVSPGHLDRILGLFYQADLQAGRLSPEGALLLLESLYILINETIPDGLAVSVMVGGRDSAGKDVTNPLSYLCLEALRRTRLVYPTVGICWHAGTPAGLTSLAIELISKGYPNPAFFGDETIQRGLGQYGVPPEEACEYVNSTCVEITPCGSSNVWVASPYFSTCKILVDEIADQVLHSDEAQTFEAFLGRYHQRVSRQIGEAVEAENEKRRLRWQFGGKPLQSIFTRDCLSRGQDIDRGGARYNWIECSFVGLANLADALYVLREEVFEQKRLTLAELHHVLQADYVGFEPLRQRFLNGYPKYGNDCAAVDSLVGETVAFLQQECARHQVEPEGSPYVPGAFCWIMHEQLGRECGATPDGRRAGFPFADGCGAAQGREQAGPTAAVLSITSWDAAPLIGGAAFNMKFPASLFSDTAALQKLQNLVEIFLKRGGFETQINVLDHNQLRQAQLDPESYRDLVVRIGGYTDYFTRLTLEMQAEIILRTQYGSL